jgi:hypothetical protein
VNAHTKQYHIVEEVLLSEPLIFQWKSKGVGAPNAHYVMDDEWNYTMLYMYTTMEEVQPYFKIFDKTYWKRSGQPTLKQLDSRAWGQRWSKLRKVVPFTCNFSLHPFFICNCRSSITCM